MPSTGCQQLQILHTLSRHFSFFSLLFHFFCHLLCYLLLLLGTMGMPLIIIGVSIFVAVWLGARLIKNVTIPPMASAKHVSLRIRRMCRNEPCGYNHFPFCLNN